MAVLPDNQINTLLTYKSHAFAFISDTKVTYNVDRQNALVNTTFTVTTELKEAQGGYQNSTIMSLYRHQWLHSNDINTSFTYPSARGEMKVHEGNSFTVSTPYYGILPALPAVYLDKATVKAKLENDLNEFKSNHDKFIQPKYLFQG